MTAFIDREIEQISKMINDQVCSASTVREFNHIIDQLLQETKRIADERDRTIESYREHMEQLIRSKDARIQNLEHNINVLNSKMTVSLRQFQLNTLKSEADLSKNATQKEIRSTPSSIQSQGGGNSAKKHAVYGKDDASMTTASKIQKIDQPTSSGNANLRNIQNYNSYVSIKQLSFGCEE